MGQTLVKLSNGALCKGAPLLCQLTNGAPMQSAPLLCVLLDQTLVKLSNGALFTSCAITVLVTNGLPTHGAPLLNSNGAPHVQCAINSHISYSPFSSSDPWSRVNHALTYTVIAYIMIKSRRK